MSRIILLFLIAWACAAADFKAGLAALPITPRGSVRMSGYGGRKERSQGIVHDLWTKALALEDSRGRFVLITLDLVTIPGSLSAEVSARLAKEYKLPRERVLINCSHTHAGPVLRPNTYSEPEVPESMAGEVEQYTEWLGGEMVKVAGAALRDLAPARLSIAHGEAGFGGNRREPTPQGIKIGINPNGPVDHDVPVIAITSPSGRLRGILFAYACHNTTLTAKFYQISGDYAGFAQIELQKRHPGAIALFMQLCGADQNPQPRGTLELAAQHGNELADAVDRALASRARRLTPPLRTAFDTVELAFPAYSREHYTALLQDSRHAPQARRMLARLDAGNPIRGISYPVQVVRFGKSLTLVALGGEVVVDYGLRAKREFRAEDLIVAGYSNDVMCYIPSRRVLKEGGYEADESLVGDGMPGPFDDSIEERIFAAIRAGLRQTGWRVR